MIKIKLIIISILLVNSFVFPTILSKSQNNTPTLLIDSISLNPVLWKDVQSSLSGRRSGNLLFNLNINITFIFPHETLFTGAFASGCGVSIFLANTSYWQIFNFSHSCPSISINRRVSAGTYNFGLYTYINSRNNYTNNNFPKILNLYAMTTFNTPQYKSKIYKYNLDENQTSYNQSKPIFNNFSVISRNELIFIISGVIISSLGVLTLVEYRKYSSLKQNNPNLSSFRKYLGNKHLKAEKIENPKL